ncbi:MAG: hypothetical protein ACFE9L_20565 [Candidatus Hodarchaeota archaeon]
MKPKSETNMKNTLFHIITHKDFKWVLISSVIIINFIGLMVGSLLAGQSYTHIESLVINGERSFEIYPYPMSNEIIITANSTNTEKLNFTGFTSYADTGLFDEFILMPGENVSILQGRLAVRGNPIDISFQKPSEPQGVIISIRGRNKTLIELLRGFRTPESAGFYIILKMPLS